MDPDVASPNDLVLVAGSIDALLAALTHEGEEPAPPDVVEKLGERGTLEQARRYLESGGLLVANLAGRTLAEEAARHGNYAVMRLCVEAGAPIDGLLHFAAPADSPEAIRFLLSHGADPNARNSSGQTPLDRAIEPTIYRILEEAGALHAARSKPPHLR